MPGDKILLRLSTLRRNQVNLAPLAKARSKTTQQWKLVQQVAEKYAPRMAKVITAAVAEIKDSVTLKEISAHLTRGDIIAAEAAIPWETINLTKLQPAITEIFRDSMEESAQLQAELENEIFGDMRFDVTNLRAVQWARDSSSTLVREINASQRAAIRTIITQAFEEGLHPYQSAKLIMENVGLLNSQSQAVFRFRQQLIEAGVSIAKVNERVERYARKLLKYRARNIARTETLRSSNMGQHELWRQGIDNNLLTTSKIQRVWIVTPDDRLCDICAPMNGQTVAMEEHFTGNKQNAAGVVTHLYSTLTPPIHPSCRCAIGIQRIA